MVGSSSSLLPTSKLLALLLHTGGTLVHKLLQGQFFVAGHQGPRRDKGEVQPPSGLVRNAETLDPKAFELRHARPGTLSLCLGQNDDDDGIKINPVCHNVEFLVTTGPWPCPELDGQNIVFGTVLEALSGRRRSRGRAEGGGTEDPSGRARAAGRPGGNADRRGAAEEAGEATGWETATGAEAEEPRPTAAGRQGGSYDGGGAEAGDGGGRESATAAAAAAQGGRRRRGTLGMDVITSIVTIHTYKPAERIRFFNDFAQLIGDERAQTARAMWDRPLKTAYISDWGAQSDQAISFPS